MIKLLSILITCIVLLHLFVDGVLRTPQTVIWVYRNCPERLMDIYGILVTKENTTLLGKDVLPLSERFPGIYISRSSEDNHIMYSPSFDLFPLPTVLTDAASGDLYRDSNKNVLLQIYEHGGAFCINNCSETQVKPRRDGVHVLFLKNRIFIIDFPCAEYGYTPRW